MTKQHNGCLDGPAGNDGTRFCTGRSKAPSCIDDSFLAWASMPYDLSTTLRSSTSSAASSSEKDPIHQRGHNGIRAARNASASQCSSSLSFSIVTGRGGGVTALAAVARVVVGIVVGDFVVLVFCSIVAVAGGGEGRRRRQFLRETGGKMFGSAKNRVHCA